MRILLVDKHDVVRAGMHAIVKDIEERIIFDDARCMNDARQMVQTNNYNVVLIGLSLPDLEGFGTLVEIKRNKPNLPVVVVGMHADEQLAVKAYVRGADGFVEADNA